MLEDGTLLVAGGKDIGGHVLATAEIFDDWTEAFQTIGTMGIPAYGAYAAVLRNGRRR